MWDCFNNNIIMLSHNDASRVINLDANSGMISDLTAQYSCHLTTLTRDKFVQRYGKGLTVNKSVLEVSGQALA